MARRRECVEDLRSRRGHSHSLYTQSIFLSAPAARFTLFFSARSCDCVLYGRRVISGNI